MEALGNPSTLFPLITALVVAGAAIGFLAGLFGVGGGAISVPVFFEIFQTLGYAPEVAMPVAVGTSLAVIAPTSLASARGHHKRGTLDVEILRNWALPILLGVAVGAFIARFAPPAVFQTAFACVASIIAIRFLTGGARWKLYEKLPGPVVMRASGAGIGLISAIIGIGGGAISTMFLSFFGAPIHRAISTSAGVGALISIPGTLGYILAGWGRGDLPPATLGFVSLAAFAVSIPTSLMTTRGGVALAHMLSRRALELAFGAFLVLVAGRFIYALLSAAP